MFLRTLNLEEKRAFLSLASRFIAADGRLDPKEEAMLAEMKQEMGIDQGWEGRAEAQLLSSFKTRPSRIAALLELLGLAHSDSEYSAQESAFVARAAQAFGVEPLELATLENWILRQIALMREAHLFMEEG